MAKVTKSELLEVLDYIGTQLPVYMKAREPFEAMVARVRDVGLEGDVAPRTAPSKIDQAEARDVAYRIDPMWPEIMRSDIARLTGRAARVEGHLDTIARSIDGRLDTLAIQLGEVRDELDEGVIIRQPDDDQVEGSDAAINLTLTALDGRIIVAGSFKDSRARDATEAITRSIESLRCEKDGSEIHFVIA